MLNEYNELAKAPIKSRPHVERESWNQSLEVQSSDNKENKIANVQSENGLTLYFYLIILDNLKGLN